MPRLTQKAFLAWLEQQPPRRRMEPMECSSCPLALFLLCGHARGESVVVGREGYVRRKRGTVDAEEVPLPKWGQAFIATFDDQFGYNAAAALRVLREQMGAK